jgi:uncharacterized pyridoxal phosphate-containing UPF0001 family protein
LELTVALLNQFVEEREQRGFFHRVRNLQRESLHFHFVVQIQVGKLIDKIAFDAARKRG